jgi:hypothetical protein
MGLSHNKQVIQSSPIEPEPLVPEFKVKLITRFIILKYIYFIVSEGYLEDMSSGVNFARSVWNNCHEYSIFFTSFIRMFVFFIEHTFGSRGVEFDITRSEYDLVKMELLVDRLTRMINNDNQIIELISTYPSEFAYSKDVSKEFNTSVLDIFSDEEIARDLGAEIMADLRRGMRTKWRMRYLHCLMFERKYAQYFEM